MRESEYTVEDFVLDPNFKKWVLENNPESTAYWVEFVSQNPEEVRKIKIAKEILLNLSRQKKELSPIQINQLFKRINNSIDSPESRENEEIAKVRKIEIDNWTLLKQYNLDQEQKKRKSAFFRMAAIFTLLLGFGAFIYFSTLQPQEEIQASTIQWITFEAPAGVKSTINLEDGTKIYLNSGSFVTYPKNFPEGTRSLTLTGEAFFEVARDTLRPFQVSSGHLTTFALGTSFNIKAYPSQSISISLIEGKVRVEDQTKIDNQILLAPGEAIKSDLEKNIWKKSSFNQEDILGWMNKTLVFNNIPLNEAISLMENWYGVKFIISGIPPKDLNVSGKFKDETLQNILDGLSFSNHLTYSIQGKQVNLKFKP